MKELKKTKGTICISHELDCPHCGADLSDTNLPRWFGSNLFETPTEENWKAEYEVLCPRCNEKFIVTYFEY